MKPVYLAQFVLPEINPYQMFEMNETHLNFFQEKSQNGILYQSPTEKEEKNDKEEQKEKVIDSVFGKY